MSARLAKGYVRIVICDWRTVNLYYVYTQAYAQQPTTYVAQNQYMAQGQRILLRYVGIRPAAQRSAYDIRSLPTARVACCLRQAQLGPTACVALYLRQTQLAAWGVKQRSAYDIRSLWPTALLRLTYEASSSFS